MNTELHGPQAGNCAEQFLVVGGDIWPTGFDKICGVNPDQHFYVHLDREKQAEADQGGARCRCSEGGCTLFHSVHGFGFGRTI